MKRAMRTKQLEAIADAIRNSDGRERTVRDWLTYLNSKLSTKQAIRSTKQLGSLFRLVSLKGCEIISKKIRSADEEGIIYEKKYYCLKKEETT